MDSLRRFSISAVAAAESAPETFDVAGDTPDSSTRRHEVDSIGVVFDDLRTLHLEPVDHVLAQLATDLGEAAATRIPRLTSGYLHRIMSIG